MKVVVTGGSGALGQKVVEELCAHGHTVLAIDRKPHPAGHRPSWSADLLDAGAVFEALAGADAVVHLAAHIAPGFAPDTSTFNENVALTYNVLKAAHSCGLRRVVLASSIAAYGFLYARHAQMPDYLPIDEAHPCSPTDPYGLSKVVAERLADSFARLGLDIVSLRLPGINYDPAFRRLLGLMNNPAFRAPGFWTYVDVRDAAAACRLAAEASTAGHHVLNVAAPNSNMREPTPSLIRRFFPSLTDIRGGAGNWSGMDSRRAEAELGFRAVHTWDRLHEGGSPEGR